MRRGAVLSGAAGRKFAVAPLATLVEDFSTEDRARWTYSDTVTVKSGRLALPCTPSYGGVITAAAWKLTGSSVTVELTQLPNLGTGTTSAVMHAQVSVGNDVRWTWEGGTLSALRYVGGVSTSVASVAYSATNHRWLRISEAAGMVTWATSADGLTWTSFGTWAPTFSVAAVTLGFLSGYYGTETSPGVATFDNLNLAPLRVFYVDPAGNNANAGTSAGAAWATIAKVNSTTLLAGDAVLFNRGGTWTSANLVVNQSGTATNPIIIGSYGSGALPILNGSATATPIRVNGNRVTVREVRVTSGGGDTDKTGLAVYGDDAVVERIEATGNGVGVQAFDGADRIKVLGSELFNNTITIIGSGPDDDYGANGLVLQQCDGCEIAWNLIHGNSGASPDYGIDGSAVEIFGATNSVIHHNTGYDNPTFTELGRTSTNNITYHNNLIYSAVKAEGLTVQGTGTFGPVTNITFVNNTVALTHADATALYIGAGATVHIHNNIFQAPYIGWIENTPIDEGHNVYVGYAGDIKSTNHATQSAMDETSVNPVSAGFVSSSDYHLAAGSAALNIGEPVPHLTDLDGNVRTFGAAPDAGCYERQS